MLERDTVAAGEAARRLGVSTATIQRLVDRGLLAAQRTAGGHRRILLVDLHRLVAEMRPRELAGPLAAWLDIVLTGDTAKVRKLLLSCRENAGSWAKAADEVAAVIAELGQLWELGRCAVYEEHVATEALRRAAASCAADIALPKGAPKAILLTVEGERHTLGLSLAELVLREKGWHPIWIGEGPPILEILPMVRGLKPKLVVLAASPRLSRRAVSTYESTLQEAASTGSAEIIVAGGAAWTVTSAERRMDKFEDFGVLVGTLA